MERYNINIQVHVNRLGNKVILKIIFLERLLKIFSYINIIGNQILLKNN
ncbi:hypothetical protein [Buchnera aphidicola]|nr:hypothetical protein [Buchnera aphidicola (Stegophylla sp.)]